MITLKNETNFFSSSSKLIIFHLISLPFLHNKLNSTQLMSVGFFFSFLSSQIQLYFILNYNNYYYLEMSGLLSSFNSN